MEAYMKTEISTDVLVIGGGIAAIFAAKRAADNGADVTLADKGSLGRSGQSPFASEMAVFDEDLGHDRENWHMIMKENAYNLNNPAYLDNMMDYSKEVYAQIEEWGATEMGFGGVLREKILAEGIEVIERTMITTLLEDNGLVAGAVGFKLDALEALVIKAKSVILCTGAGGFKPSGFQICSLTFDGDAMAYRIGAKISGKEYVDTHSGGSENPAYCWGGWSRNWTIGMPKGTTGPLDGGGMALDLTQYHAIHDGTSSDTMGEMAEGPPDGEMPEGEQGGDISEVPSEGERPEGGPPDRERPEGAPDGESEGERLSGGPGDSSSMIGGTSAGLSVHKAEGLFPSDGKCATNITGLYAAGDCLSSMLVGPSYNGVLGFAFSGSATQGTAAGKAAAEYSKSSIEASISDDYIDTAIGEMFQPLNNEQGYAPEWVEHLIQGTLIPYYVLYIKHEDRLNSALTNIEFYRDHFAVKLRADDIHGLRKAHEVKNMLLNAEMKLKASLFRTESRGNHYREEYPDMDDQNWLVWVVIQKGNDGNMELGKFMVEDFIS